MIKQSMTVWSVLLILIAAMAGCSESEPAPDTESQPGGQVEGEAVPATAEAVVHRYPLRGRIVSLPDPTDPTSELKIQHEAIDDFKMSDGELAPMRQMTMAFSAGADDSLAGAAVGDVISFVFEMQWTPSREMRAVEVEKLPAGTVLNFEGAGDAGGGAHDGH